MGTSADVDFIAFFFLNQIINFSMKSLLVYQKFFCLVALLVFEKIFTLEVTQVIIQCYNNNAKFILNENKHSIIMR